MMYKEYLETYKGVRISYYLQTHTSHVSEFLGHGHLMRKNPAWRPSKPLLAPVYHVGSLDVVTTNTSSKDLQTAIKRYKEKLDALLASAKWKESRGYATHLFKPSEKFMLAQELVDAG